MNGTPPGITALAHFLEIDDCPHECTAAEAGPASRSIAFVVDDDYFSRSTARMMLEDAGLAVQEFEDCETFLAAYEPSPQSCLVLDVHFPGMGGLELLRTMQRVAHLMPTIMVSGDSGVSEAVQSMKSGAIDFIEKPLCTEALLAAVHNALEHSRRRTSVSHRRAVAVDRLADLTARQREIMKLVLEGLPSKNIAADLGISQRTVENHRASIMHKTGATSLPALARLMIAAAP